MSADSELFNPNIPMDRQPGMTEEFQTDAISDPEQQKNLLSNEDVLAQLGYFFKGWYFDPTVKDSEGRVVGGYSESKYPLVSDEGFPVLMNELQLRLSKVFSAGGPLTDEELAVRSEQFITDFKREVWLRRGEFGIKAVSFSRIINAIDDACYFTAKKSQGALLLKLLQKNTRVIETRAFGNPKYDKREIFR